MGSLMMPETRREAWRRAVDALGRIIEAATELDRDDADVAADGALEDIADAIALRFGLTLPEPEAPEGERVRRALERILYAHEEDFASDHDAAIQNGHDVLNNLTRPEPAPPEQTEGDPWEPTEDDGDWALRRYIENQNGIAWFQKGTNAPSAFRSILRWWSREVRARLSPAPTAKGRIDGNGRDLLRNMLRHWGLPYVDIRAKRLAEALEKHIEAEPMRRVSRAELRQAAEAFRMAEGRNPLREDAHVVGVRAALESVGVEIEDPTPHHWRRGCRLT